MVGVEVGEDDGVEGRDAEPGQAAVDERRVGPGIDEDGPARTAAQDDGIPLPDVAHDDPPPGRRPGDGRVGTRAAAVRRRRTPGRAGVRRDGADEGAPR